MYTPAANVYIALISKLNRDPPGTSKVRETVTPYLHVGYILNKEYFNFVGRTTTKKALSPFPPHLSLKFLMRKFGKFYI